MSRSGNPESLGLVWRRDVPFVDCKRDFDQRAEAFGKARDGLSQSIGVYGPPALVKP